MACLCINTHTLIPSLSFTISYSILYFYFTTSYYTCGIGHNVSKIPYSQSYRNVMLKNTGKKISLSLLLLLILLLGYRLTSLYFPKLLYPLCHTYYSQRVSKFSFASNIQFFFPLDLVIFLFLTPNKQLQVHLLANTKDIYPDAKQDL